MKKILSKLFFSGTLSALVLTALATVLALKNYLPGTWLTGWDNLHPEFDLILNIRRSLFASWQEYQGLGLLGGMAHAADLPRQLVLWLFSLVLRPSDLRYAWTFLMLILGPIGTYSFVKFSFKKNKAASELAGLAAGAFYLLNLATLQTFYTPFEAFVSFYGFFPWLVYLFSRFVYSGKRKYLWGFFIVSFLATAAFYVQTLFVVYGIVLAVLAVEALAASKGRAIYRLLAAGMVILTANAFWLFPTIYFTVKGSKIVQESKINSIATIETRLMNQGYGQWENIARLKGFWFDYVDLGREETYDYLYKDWRDCSGQPNVEKTAYAVFGLAVFGLVLNLFNKRSRNRSAPLLIFVIAYFMLATTNPPFGSVFQFLTDRLPLFKEIFRSVFTKWSLVAAFTYAYGIGSVVFLLGNLAKGRWKGLSLIALLALTTAAGFTVRPAFEGKLISERMRLVIPQAYFSLFDYFKGEDSQTRVAFYPVQTYWGWNFYNWGYTGSGFLWYGIKQPVLDRAFDVWSNYNESFYHEFATAVYRGDSQSIKNALNKYDVDFILIDRNIILPEQSEEVLGFATIDDLLIQTGLEKTFSREALSVYRYRNENQPGFVYSPRTYALVANEPQLTREDIVYEQVGDYVEATELTESKNYSLFPFTDLTGEAVAEVAYESEGELTKIKLTRSLNTEETNELVIPPLPVGTQYSTKAVLSYSNGKVEIGFPEPMTVFLGEREETLGNLPTIYIRIGLARKNLLVSFGEQIVSLSLNQEKSVVVNLKVGEPAELMVFNADGATDYNLKSEFLKQAPDKCWTREGKNGLVETEPAGDGLSLTTEDAVGCLSFKIGQLNVNQALLTVALPFRSENGARPDFCVVEEGVDRCENREIFYVTPTSREWENAERKMILKGNTNYWLTVRARPPDKEGDRWNIEYQSPEVKSYPIIAGARFTAGVWKQMAAETRIPVTKNDQTVSLVYYSNESLVDFTRSGRPAPYNCDIFDRGQVEKTVAENQVVYQAREKATICDYVPLSNLSTNDSYLMRFKGEGISGRGIKIHLFNKTSQRNDIETVLPEGVFDKSLVLVPWNFADDQGYVLNIGIRSFGNEVSKNRLDKVAVYNLPLDWLSAWLVAIEKPEETPLTETASTTSTPEPELPDETKSENLLTIAETAKIGTFLYTVKVDSQQTDGLIILSQAFDAGWRAYSFPKAELNFFNKYLPWLTGKPLTSHLTANGWANSWQPPEGKFYLVLVYLPQYLEFFGLILLILTVPALLLKRTKVEKSAATAGGLTYSFPRHL